MRPRGIYGLAPLLLVLAACETEPADISLTTGGDSSSSSNNNNNNNNNAVSEGRAYFDANVRPILELACASCHADGSSYPNVIFLGSSPAEYYDYLVADVDMVNADPNSSLLLLKGQHTGPELTEDQAAKVRAWLEIEKTRFWTGGGITCDEAKAQFSTCMKLDDWVGKGMPNVGLQHSFKEGKDQGPCFKCHASGTGGNFMANPDDALEVEQLFGLMKKTPFIENLVTCQIDPKTAQFQNIIQSELWKNKGADVEVHPKYALDEEHTQAIDSWFNVTHQQWKNNGGPCP